MHEKTKAPVWKLQATVLGNLPGTFLRVRVTNPNCSGTIRVRRHSFWNN